MYSIWDNKAYMYTHHCSIRPTSILDNAKIEILYFLTNTLFYYVGDLNDYMILLLVLVGLIHAYIAIDQNLYGTGIA